MNLEEKRANGGIQGISETFIFFLEDPALITCVWNFVAKDLTVAVDDMNDVVALAYCNDKMRTLYEEYPEILTIDSSNFIDSLNLTHVILFFVVDSLGEVRPVMLAMILKSNETMYEWLLNEFVRE